MISMKPRSVDKKGVVLPPFPLRVPSQPPLDSTQSHLPDETVIKG